MIWLLWTPVSLQNGGIFRQRPKSKMAVDTISMNYFCNQIAKHHVWRHFFGYECCTKIHNNHYVYRGSRLFCTAFYFLNDWEIYPMRHVICRVQTGPCGKERVPLNFPHRHSRQSVYVSVRMSKVCFNNDQRVCTNRNNIYLHTAV